tara:strand:+ start:646 stop:2517 length:1872 start_codon:yes stop_codon:yes gene_type:complete
MRISKKTIDEIFNTAIIEEVISEFVLLKKTGANYKGLSPFNDEKTPSFVVSPSKEIWKDFSSGKGGNVVSFLMEHEQYTYPEALLYLAKKYNIDVEFIELDADAQKKATEREAALLVLNFAKKYFCDNLMGEDTLAIDYLYSRGFDNSTIQDFELGFCPKVDKKLIESTKEAGYSTELLLKTRIVNEKYQNRFAGRLIFPIHSITGQVLGFGGRVLEGNVKKAKYLNSDSSELYQKSKLLYGLHLAKKHIKKLDFCYIVEGYTDVMALYQSGIKNVVSNCGTALTNEQVRLIKRFTNNIVMLFDSDNAGLSATLKAIDIVLKQNMFPKVLQLPQNDDPASFVTKKSYEEIYEFFKENAIDFIEFKYKVSNNSDTVGLIQVTKDIVSSIALIDDTISQALHLRKASKLLNISENDLTIELKKTNISSKNLSESSGGKKLENRDSSNLTMSDLQSKYIEEFQLIRLFINYGTSLYSSSDKQQFNVADFICSELDRDNIVFSVELFQDVFSYVKTNLSTNNSISKDNFLSHNSQSIRDLAAFVIGQKYLLSNWKQKDIIVLEEEDRLFAITKESILRFKLKRVQDMVQDSLLKLKSIEIDDEKTLQNFSNLSNLEKKIQKELGRLF